MLFTGDTLTNALKTIVHLVPRRSTLPVLEHVLFETTNIDVSITATDLTTQAVVTVPAQAPFATCLPARPLLEFVKSVDGDTEVTLAQHGKVVRVTAAGAMLELPAIPPADFPARIKHVGASVDVEDPKVFLEALAWVSRAIGTDETRPQLTGLYFDGSHLVATDGHRLHKARIDGLACPRALVPASAVAFVLRALRGGDVEISVGEKTVQFRSLSWTITTRLIDATFPAYEQVIPKANRAGFTMRVGTGDLEAGLKRVCGRGPRRGEKLMKLRANGAIKLESNIEDVQRSANVGVIDSSHEGDDHVQGFNGRYLGEALTDSDNVATLRFFKAEDPLVIETGDRMTAVVMPCRL